MTKYVAMIDGVAQIIVEDSTMGAACDQAAQELGICEDDICMAEWDALTEQERQESDREIAAR